MTAARLYAIWAAIGPLVGVVIGAWLAAHWQAKRWIQDNKTAEYRQLLDALQTYRWRLLNHLALVSAGPIYAVDPKEQRALADAEVSLSNCLADRLFVRNQLSRSRVREEFREFQAASRGDRDSISDAIEVLSDFHERILEGAEKDLRLK